MPLMHHHLHLALPVVYEIASMPGRHAFHSLKPSSKSTSCEYTVDQIQHIILPAPTAWASSILTSYASIKQARSRLAHAVSSARCVWQEYTDNA